MDASTAIQTTLLLLYFITPPSNLPKNESKSIWTLQSTSQIDFATPAACRTIGKVIIADIRPVATMTIRAYCLCANGDGTVCLGSDGIKTMADANKKTVPTVERLGR